jgi:glycosyltransferase involved in cell wall biosynthesis
MSRRILHGLQKAAVVFCSTRTTQRRILELGLVDPKRLVYAPYGVSPPFASSLQALSGATDLAANGANNRPGTDFSSFLLHVGSCIPRKRIDVLLSVFAELKARFSELQLVQIGGEWTREQQEQIKRLDITRDVYQQRGIDRRNLGRLYRQARVVLQPSEAEGFGLPVLEALASGAIVVASDIPVLREVGGDGAVYCPVADISNWVLTIEKILHDSQVAPDRARRLAQAQRFSWDRHAEIILQAYHDECLRFAPAICGDSRYVTGAKRKPA